MRKRRSVYSFENAIFDMDGTLIDSVPYCDSIFADLLSPYGIPRDIAARYYRGTTGSSMHEQLAGLLDHYGVQADRKTVDALHFEFERRFHETPTRFFPGVLGLLVALHGQGVRLFVSSASPDRTVGKRLEDGGIAGIFMDALGSTAIPKGPAHLARFARTAGMDAPAFAAASFMCGDGETDMRIASAEGVYAIGIAGTVSIRRLRAAGAARTARSVGELINDPR